MKLEKAIQIFSKMEWIVRDKNDRAVEIMRKIREKQNSGIIPLDEYKEIFRWYSDNFCKEFSYLESPLLGYYLMNIVYDFYSGYPEEIDDVEDRFIFFLQNYGNKFSLTKDKDFIDDFIIDCYRRFLMWIKRTPTNSYDLIIEQGSFVGKEKEIFQLLWNLYIKNEYIVEHARIDWESTDTKDLFSRLEDAQIIDIDEYDNQDYFITVCKDIIKNRIEIIKQNSILSFKECHNHQMLELKKLKHIIFFCGPYNYELEDLLYCILEEYCECLVDKCSDRFGLSLVIDY